MINRLEPSGLPSRFASGLFPRPWSGLNVIALGASVLAVAAILATQPARTPGAAGKSQPRNAIIFVADGLRPGSVNPVDTPTLWWVRQNGVFFANSHSVFPTFTTPNSSAIATGHYLGDTGDFSNTIFAGYTVQLPRPGFTTPPNTATATPFVENNPILGDLDDHYGGNYLTEESLLAAARKAGFNTAAVGKLGPTLIQDVTEGRPDAATGAVPPPQTIIIDDSTGRPGGLPLNSRITTALNVAGLPLTAPDRTNGNPSTSQMSNGFSGNNTTPGTLAANTNQQQYFANTVSQAILPLFHADYTASTAPFVLVFWSRDPDGTQHNQGDSLNTLTPGINGPTSIKAARNADANLAQILSYLKTSGLDATTDVFITADHGFGTISRQLLDANGTKTWSYAASLTFPGVNAGFLPPGFVAMDLAHALGLPLFDPDPAISPIPPNVFPPKVFPAVDPTKGQRTRNGNGLIGGTGTYQTHPDAALVVAANGGSDLIYMPEANYPVTANGTTYNTATDMVKEVVALLAKQDYISGIFVNDLHGDVPGSLPLSAIKLDGNTGMPTPDVVVNFRTFALDATNPTMTGVELADTGLQQGQGMHGSFGRQDTFNNMAAIGPDFKQGFVDPAPISNADVAPTLAYLLGLYNNVSPKGKLTGRVIVEALENHSGRVYALSAVLPSNQADAATGMRTYLLYQQFGDRTYLTASGFADRTIGLPVLAGNSGDETLQAGAAYLCVDGRGGNDVLIGGRNATMLVGGPGTDIFVLSRNHGTATLFDYRAAEGDKIGLADGLTFDQLAFRSGVGANAGNALVFSKRSGQMLGIVRNTSTGQLGPGNFITYP